MVASILKLGVTVRYFSIFELSDSRLDVLYLYKKYFSNYTSITLYRHWDRKIRIECMLVMCRVL